ncbi:MAG: LamG domain-containing protein [Candidatus Kapaibacterium sp.]
MNQRENNHNINHWYEYLVILIISLGLITIGDSGCSDGGIRVVVDTLTIRDTLTEKDTLIKRDTLVINDTVTIIKDTAKFKSKYAMNFSGDNGRIVVPNISIVTGGNSTRMVWIYVSSLPNLQSWIMGLGARESLVIKTNGKVAFTNLFPSGWNGVEDPITLPLNRWVHYAGTVIQGVNETIMNLYRDGVLVSSVKVPQNMKQNSGCNIFIGGVETGGIGECYFTDSQSFKGVIDEASFWNIALTQEQIRSKMREHLSSEVGLTAYFSFEHVEGTQVLDEINQANTGKMSDKGVSWFPLSFTPPFRKK